MLCVYLRCRQAYALQSGVTQRQVNMAFDKQELIELILASDAPDTAAVRLPVLRSSSLSLSHRELVSLSHRELVSLSHREIVSLS